MLITIRHKLSLTLGPGIIRSVQHVLLTPQTGPTQTVREWAIDMPGFAEAASFLDGFGNRAQLVSQHRPEAELVVSVSSVVETIDRNGVVGRVAGEPPPALYRRPSPLAKAAGAITSKFRSGPKGGQGRIALLHDLMARVEEVVGGAQTQSQSQSQGGQSQSQSQGEAVTAAAADFAHAFIGAARGLEIPARYVTGYVAEHGEDAYWHAWAEAWDEGLGWIGFDPTLGYCPTDKHVRVAVGLDAGSVPPVRSVPVIAAPVVELTVAGQ
ncbi:MAG: transglutaminase domain-containing protein [Devosia sp.]|nr:transglutaminase domain-containing protein [Devosia sp.]